MLLPAVVSLVLATSPDGGRVPPADEGLVLGIRSALDGTLRTYLVTQHDARLLGEGLALPTPDGWKQVIEDVPVPGASDWRAVALRDAGRGHATGELRVPFREAPTLDKDLSDDCGEAAGRDQHRDISDTLRISFAAPSLVTVLERGGVDDCGAHPHGFEVVRSYPLTRRGFGGRVQIKAADALLGRGAADALFLAGKASAKEAGSYLATSSRAEWDNVDWHLFHQSGVWRLVGSRPDLGVGVSEEYEDFPVDFAPTGILLGGSRSVSPKDLADAGARDGICAPSGRWWVGLEEGGLVLVTGSSDEHRPFRELTKPSDPDEVEVVMTQWAVGSQNVARWEHDLEFMAKR